MPDKSMGFSVFGKDRGMEALLRKLGESVDRLNRKLDELDRKRVDPEIDVDTKKAEAQVGAFASSMQRRIERAIRSLPDIELKADASAADRRIAEIRRELQELSGKTVGVDIDATAAKAKIEQLRRELVALGARSPSIQVRADTAAAAAALAAVNSQARRLDGQRVNIAVNASGVSRAISLLGLLTAGLASASALVAPAGAVLASLPTAASGAVQGIAGVATAFSGVGDAVKALSDEQSKAAAGVESSTKSQVNSAQALISAQRGVEDAVIQADRAAITGAQQVADARQAVTDTYEQGLERVKAAEQDYTAAQKESKAAQEDLTRAREDAKEAIDDLGRSLRGAALDEREAEIRLAEAQERLLAAQQSGTGAPRDLEQLQIDAEQAELALENAKDRHEDLTKEMEHSNQVGVEGSDQVVAAQGRVNDANDRVKASEQAISDARDQASKDNARANEQLQRAIQQAGFAQQDAARRVEDAQRALANVYADTGAAGSASADKVKLAMSDLGPEAQEFARFLVGEVLPGLKEIRKEVQAEALPRFETSLRNMKQLAPEISEGLAGTARVVGDLAVQGSEMMTSGPWQRDFRTIMEGNNLVLEDFGHAGLDVVDMWRNMSVASLPMVERFSTFIERSTALGRQFLDAKRASGELDAFFDQMGDHLAELGQVVADIVVGLYNLSQTMAPLGMTVLQVVASLVQFLGELAQAHPLITQVIGTVLIGVGAFNAIGKAVAGAAIAANVAGGGWKTLIENVGKLSPTAIAGSTAMTTVARGMDAVALSAGTFTERVSGSAAAGEKVATAGAKVSTVLTKVGSALPLVGAVVIGLTAAFEALYTSTDEAAGALMEGGKAAADMRAQLAEGDKQAEEIGFGYGILRTKLSDATDEMNRQRMAQDPLTRATQDAARAQKDYLFALEQGDMQGAAEAQNRYAQATAEVARQQSILDSNLKDTNKSLEEQIGIVLSAVEQDIRYRDAVDAVTKSVQENGATHDLNTDAGRRNQQALIDMSRAAMDNMDAMQKNGASADEMRAFHDQARQELIRQASQMGFNASEAQNLADKYLGIRAIGNITTQFIADTFPAVDAVFRMQGDISRAVAAIQDEQVSIKFVGSAPNDSGNILNRATGGPILGRGTETSDSNLAKVSHNEHVWTAREVHGAGGHSEVARLRKMAAAGRLPGFAAGGPVFWTSTDRFDSQGVNTVVDANVTAIKELVKRAMAEAMPGPGGGTEQWRPVGLQALSIERQAASNIGRLLMQMGTESGGNPTVVNKWDINWQRGTPSVGLMQVIGPTYRTYRNPQWDRGPYSYGVSVDPLANILASIRYTLSAYGSLSAGWQGHGYDQGGLLPTGAVGWNLSGRPEQVLSPEQTLAFKRLVDVLSHRQAGGAPLQYAFTGAGAGVWGPGTGGGADSPSQVLPRMVPLFQSAFLSALRAVFAQGFRTDINYDQLLIRLNSSQRGFARR